MRATLDWVNDFTLFGHTFAWDGNFLEYVGVNGPDTPLTDTANLTLSGSDWSLRVLEFNGNGLTGTVTDAPDRRATGSTCCVWAMGQTT